MSLEPITKKDIENLFNKILRTQIERQKMECVHQSDKKQKEKTIKKNHH